MSALDEDLEDLKVVAQYLQTNYGYNIELVVGHSRGSVVAMRWIATTEMGRRVQGFVNVSGRYRMEVRTAIIMYTRWIHMIRKIAHSR